MTNQPKSEWIRIGELGFRFGVSRSTLRRWWIENRMPKPIVVRGVLMWRRNIIEQWENAGCPRQSQADILPPEPPPEPPTPPTPTNRMALLNQARAAQIATP